MSANVRVEYFEVLDHWSWEVTVNGNSAYGFDRTYEDALGRVKDWLKDMLEEAVDE